MHSMGVCHKVWYRKTRMVSLPDSKKKSINNMLTYFDKIHEPDGMDKQTLCDGISRAYA